jgi:hypothetical protein
MPLMTHANIADPDGFYAELIASQRDLDEAQAQRWLAQLVLILANQVGDREILRQAMSLARATTLGQASTDAPAP